jgi:hypothetical protein
MEIKLPLGTIDLVKCREEIKTATAERLRFMLFTINTWWTGIDYFKLRSFYYDEDDEAVEEIVKALKEMHKGGEPWDENEYYDQASIFLDEARKYERLRDPEQLRRYLADDLAFMQRETFLKVAHLNETPKQNSRRKRKVAITLIKGGLDADSHDELPWHANALRAKRDPKFNCNSFVR